MYFSTNPSADWACALLDLEILMMSNKPRAPPKTSSCSSNKDSLLLESETVAAKAAAAAAVGYCNSSPSSSSSGQKVTAEANSSVLALCKVDLGKTLFSSSFSLVLYSSACTDRLSLAC